MVKSKNPEISEKQPPPPIIKIIIMMIIIIIIFQQIPIRTKKIVYSPNKYPTTNTSDPRVKYLK